MVQLMLQDNFTSIIGVKRGSPLAQQKRDQDLSNWYLALIKAPAWMPGALSRQASFYDLQAIYDYGIREGHDLYEVLVSGIKEWMMMDWTTTLYARQMQMQTALAVLKKASHGFLTYPAQPLFRAIAELIREDKVDAVMMEAMLTQLFDSDYTEQNPIYYSLLTEALSSKILEPSEINSGLAMSVIAVLSKTDELYLTAMEPLIEAVASCLTTATIQYSVFAAAEKLVSERKSELFQVIENGAKTYQQQLSSF